jgi:hypothetical protein
MIDLMTISPDFIGSILGVILTLVVFSYLLGDNGLFRFGIYILVGVSAGFVAVVAWYNVIWLQLIYPIWEGGSGERSLLIFPVIMSILLLCKAFPRFSILGTPVVAYLVGVGAAAAVGGAVLGTLIPQFQSTINQINWRTADPNPGSSLLLLIDGFIFLIGAVSTLVYFQFSARSKGKSYNVRSAWIEGIAQIGQWFITIALAVIFAGVFLAALAALVERWQFLYQFVYSLLFT